MPGAVREDKAGTLCDIYDDDSGRVTEAGTANKWEFVQQGACVGRNIGFGVVYVKVTTPTGKVVIVDIKTGT